MSGITDTIDTVAPADEAVMINSFGNPVPERLVAARIKLEDQAVNDLIAKAQDMQAALAAFKLRAMEDVQAFMEALAADYKTKRAGRRGGVRLDSFDALRRVEVTVADGHSFGPGLTLAKERIDACLRRWADTARTEIRQIVEEAFRVGKTGQVRVDRILGLRKIRSADPEWMEAMALIDDALRVAASRTYIRFYTRPNTDAQWQQITLDASRL